MVLQIALGSLVVVLNVAVQILFIGFAMRVLGHIGAWLAEPPHALKTMLSLAGVTLWLLAAITVCAWTWALTYLALGTFQTLEAALYFAIVTMTTLGYGDITLSENWRLMSGISAASGLLLFGLSTAFLVEFFRQLNKAQSEMRN